MKLLIVDDSALVRRSIENVYKGQKFTDIKTASDGLLAVTLYKEFAPDVVTLDITMPYMDGLAALTEMLEYNSNSKILIVSALADHHTAIEALRRGANQFICKPFTDEDLREALDDLVLSDEAILQTRQNETSRHSERSERRDILEKTRKVSSEIKQNSKLGFRTIPARQYPSGYVEPPKISMSSNTVQYACKQPQPLRPPQ